jgi:hypothetical protein
MERETRFELATLALARRCSTTELLPLVTTMSISGGPNAVKPPFLHLGSLVLSPIARLDRCDDRDWLGIDRVRNDLPVAHLEDAVCNRSSFQVVRDHENCLTQFLVRALQHR